MRISSGDDTQQVYFVAVSPTDFKTRITGLSVFSVYRSRNGGAPVLMDTPTITEIDPVNMEGVYSLLADEDTTIAGYSEEIVFHIASVGMDQVTRSIEIYKPTIYNEIADAILKRDWALVTGEASRSILNALRFLRNKWSITSSILTVTKEDDVSIAWASNVSSDGAASPVTGSDPT